MQALITTVCEKVANSMSFVSRVPCTRVHDRVHGLTQTVYRLYTRPCTGRVHGRVCSRLVYTACQISW